MPADDALTYQLPDAEAMERLGAELARQCLPGCVIFLRGDLGAGKTTLARGFLNALGYTGPIKSPTYTLVETYQLDKFTVYHFDLYRLADPEELEFIGIRDYFTEQAVCLIEWPEQGKGYLPVADLECFISWHDAGRLVKLQASNANGNTILRQVTSNFFNG